MSTLILSGATEVCRLIPMSTLILLGATEVCRLIPMSTLILSVATEVCRLIPMSTLILSGATEVCRLIPIFTLILSRCADSSQVSLPPQRGRTRKLRNSSNPCRARPPSAKSQDTCNLLRMYINCLFLFLFLWVDDPLKLFGWQRMKHCVLFNNLGFPN